MPLFEMYVAKANKIRGLIAQFQASGMLVIWRDIEFRSDLGHRTVLDNIRPINRFRLRRQRGFREHVFHRRLIFALAHARSMASP